MENQKPTFDELPQLIYDQNLQIKELKNQIDLLSKNQTPPEIIDIPNMDVHEAALFLKLKVPTIYSKVSKGEIPSMKRGNRLYFSRKDLTLYLQEGRTKSEAEIDELASKYISSKGLNN